MKASNLPAPYGRENSFLKPVTLGYSPITICLVPCALYLVFIYV
jgi:hypothetical protein